MDETPSLYFEVTGEMPAEAEAHLRWLAQQAGVPDDGAQHRIAVDLTLAADGRVFGAIIHQSDLPSVS